MELQLTHSFPKLTNSLIDKLEDILSEKFDYPAIPTDYKEFLLKNNGGYVIPGYDAVNHNFYIEDSNNIVFDTPLRLARANDQIFTGRLYTFFCVWMENDMNEDEVEYWELSELVASNDHSKYDFDILPDRMMSIAKCSDNNFDDILCISLDSEDYGAVYYYYGMWYYPQKWMGSYYDDKKETVLQKYGLTDAKDIDDETPEGKRARYEINKVPFVKLADSFNEFLTLCRIETIES